MNLFKLDFLIFYGITASWLLVSDSKTGGGRLATWLDAILIKVETTKCKKLNFTRLALPQVIFSQETQQT